MSLSSKAIDRLFERLELTYGAEWLRKWEGSPIADVKSLWAHELGYYENSLEAVAWAIENLPERCPNAIEFRNLCHSAPSTETPRLPEPKVSPESILVEVAKLGDLKKKVLSSADSAHDGRAWARRILGRYEAGNRITPCTLRFAREALGQVGK